MEWIELLEQANTELEREKRQLTGTIQQLNEDLAELEEDNARLEYEKQSAIVRVRHEERCVAKLQESLQVVEKFKRFPENLFEVISTIQRTHASRIVFTERATESACE